MALAKRKPAPTTPSMIESEPVYGAIQTDFFPFFAWMALNCSAIVEVASSQPIRSQRPEPRAPTRLYGYFTRSGLYVFWIWDTPRRQMRGSNFGAAWPPIVFAVNAALVTSRMRPSTTFTWCPQAPSQLFECPVRKTVSLPATCPASAGSAFSR